jgi:diguanylate cyclase (GGDEF)-like protein
MPHAPAHDPVQQRHTLAYIRLILSRRPIFFMFPAAMESDFQKKRVESSLFYIRSGQWLLLMMFAIIVGIAWTDFHPLMTAHNYQLIRLIYVPVGAAILFIIYGNRIPWVHRHFHAVMFPVCVLQIVLILQHVFQASGNAYYEYAVYNLMITLLLVALGLRFFTPVLLLLYVLCGGLSLVIAEVLGLPVDGLSFFYYYIIYGTVILALAGIAERQERFAFLQELLARVQGEELTRLNRALDKIAHEDALTGIPNRRSFDDAAEREFDRARRDRQPFSLLLLDVDYFKRFNDTYGHAAGDKCLQAVAAALDHTLRRPADLAARYGGEEFVVMLPNTHAQGAAQMAERILREVELLAIPHAASAVAAHVTVSIGVKTLLPDEDIHTLKEVVKLADDALYAAKGRGRRRFVMHGGSAAELTA